MPHQRLGLGVVPFAPALSLAACDPVRSTVEIAPHWIYYIRRAGTHSFLHTEL